MPPRPPGRVPSTIGGRSAGLSWVHKAANVLNALPKSAHCTAKKDLHAIDEAERRADAAFDRFIGKHGATYDKAVACLAKDRAAQAELFNAADVLVLTMPMWNFSLPAVMKAWVDQILTPGRTFEFDASEGGLRVQPKHKIRRIVALISSGGVYTEGDPRDALTPALRAAFGFIGIEDISIAWADGQTAMIFGDHEERKQTAMEAAIEAAEDLVEDLRDL